MVSGKQQDNFEYCGNNLPRNSSIGAMGFASYLLWFYGRATVTGHTENCNQVLPHGYVPGDFTGNIVVGLHLVLTILILIAGPIQLTPWVRKAFQLFHRWTGRIYILIAFAMSISGLFMIWVRGSVGGVTQHIGIAKYSRWLYIIWAILNCRRLVMTNRGVRLGRCHTAHQ